MTLGSVVVLVAVVGGYIGLELGLFLLLKRGFRWIADRIDRISW